MSVCSQCCVVFQERTDCHFLSFCSETEHRTSEPFDWEVTDTVPLDLETARSDSDWESAEHQLPTAAGSSTTWTVKFQRWSDNIKVRLFCSELDADSRAAAVRVSASLQQNPLIWRETADVLQSGRHCYFCLLQQLSQWPSLLIGGG